MTHQPADEPRGFLMEAERILLKPDMLSLAAGIQPTPRALRQMLSSDDAVAFDGAMNALAALLQGPNGMYRKVAALAIGQLGFDADPIFDLLEYQRGQERAPDVLRAIGAAISSLQTLPTAAATELPGGSYSRGCADGGILVGDPEDSVTRRDLGLRMDPYVDADDSS